MPKPSISGDLAAGAVGGLEAFQRVEHLHRAGDHGVVLHALVVVVHLLEHGVDFQAQGLGVLAEGHVGQARPRLACSAAVSALGRALSFMPKFQTRRRKRKLPSTAASFHSSVSSGGAVNMVYRRAVSAPYFSISSCGSMPLFFDLDMVPTPS